MSSLFDSTGREYPINSLLIDEDCDRVTLPAPYAKLPSQFCMLRRNSDGKSAWVMLTDDYVRNMRMFWLGMCSNNTGKMA